MIFIVIRFQDCKPICVLEDDLESPRVFPSFVAARAFVDAMQPGFRAACSSMWILVIWS